MSKKSMTFAGVAALLVAAIAAAGLLTSCKTPGRPAPPTTNRPASSTTGTGTESWPTQVATATLTTKGTTSTDTTTSSTTKKGSGKKGSGKKGSDKKGGSVSSKIGPFPTLPEPGIPAQTVTSPLGQGEKLPPLSGAPANTISGYVSEAMSEGAKYTITMRPYGIGPSLPLGSRIAIRLVSAKQATKATKGLIKAGNYLVLANTTDGGTVTEGGTYTATLTFRYDGSKMLPILSKAKSAQ